MHHLNESPDCTVVKGKDLTTSRHPFPLTRSINGSHVCPSDILYTCSQLCTHTHTHNTPTVIPHLQSKTCKLLTKDSLLYAHTLTEWVRRHKKKGNGVVTYVVIHNNIVWLSAGLSSSPYWLGTISVMENGWANGQKNHLLMQIRCCEWQYAKARETHTMDDTGLCHTQRHFLSVNQSVACW